MELVGQVALVTGASAPQGIGRAIAIQLASMGAEVIVTDRVATGIDDVVNTIRARGGRARNVPLDVTNPAQISEVFASLTRLDILVNNAGSLAGSDWFEKTTPHEWQASFDVNLLGPMRLCQAALPLLRAQETARIINIGSTSSLGAEPGFGAYTAMKHGLVGLTKTLAAELGSVGITCNIVCPGYIATDMHMAANTRLAAEAGVSEDEIKTQRYAPVALRDAGTPQDVAYAVAYLAGPQGRYVTGITLPVAGGVPCGI